MAPLTRGKKQQAEEKGHVVLLKKRKDPERILRLGTKHKKLKRQKELETYEPFNLLSTDILQHILSFVGNGQYVFLASVSKEFHSALKSMAINDFKTHPSSYIHSWKLSKWIIKVPKNSPEYKRLRMRKKVMAREAVKYDSLYVLQNLLTMRRIKEGTIVIHDWKATFACRAIRSNSLKILKWIIEEQGWDYNSHKRKILRCSLSSNLQMIMYLHEHLNIDFTLQVLRLMIPRQESASIRYVLGILPSMTASQCCHILYLALSEDNTDIAKVVCEELYDPKNKPDMCLYGIVFCCIQRKGMNFVKSIINSTIAEQMEIGTYAHVVLVACRGGRVDLLKYLEEEVRSIPYLDRLVGLFPDNREVLAYIEQIRNQRVG